MDFEAGFQFSTALMTGCFRLFVIGLAAGAMIQIVRWL